MEHGLLMTLQAAMNCRIEEIILEVLHCAHYTFDTARKAWRTSSIQGPLFIVRRAVSPYYWIIVLNKQQHSNFLEAITADLRAERKTNQLIVLRTHANDFHGIWVPMADKLDELYDKIHTLCQADRQSRQLQDLLAIRPEAAPPQPRQVDKPVIKDEFFSAGLQFDEHVSEKERLRATMLALTQTPGFMEILLKALRSNFNY